MSFYYLVLCPFLLIAHFVIKFVVLIIIVTETAFRFVIGVGLKGWKVVIYVRVIFTVLMRILLMIYLVLIFTIIVLVFIIVVSVALITHFVLFLIIMFIFYARFLIVMSIF